MEPRAIDNDEPGYKAGYDGGLMGGDLLEQKDKTTFFGAAGSIGDTGVSYMLQIRNKKSTKKAVTMSQEDKYKAYMTAHAAHLKVTPGGVGDPILKEPDAVRRPGVDPDVFESATTNAAKRTANETQISDNTDLQTQLTKDRVRSSKKDTTKNSPWVLGLYRSLGGGATLGFEYHNKDTDKTKNQWALGLKVDF